MLWITCGQPVDKYRIMSDMGALSVSSVMLLAVYHTNSQITNIFIKIKV
jgi:hypothetical protein